MTCLLFTCLGGRNQTVSRRSEPMITVCINSICIMIDYIQKNQTFNASPTLPTPIAVPRLSHSQPPITFMESQQHQHQQKSSKRPGQKHVRRVLSQSSRFIQAHSSLTRPLPPGGSTTQTPWRGPTVLLPSTSSKVPMDPTSRIRVYSSRRAPQNLSRRSSQARTL